MFLYVLNKIYNLLIKVEERLDSIEGYLKKYEQKEEKKQLLND